MSIRFADRVITCTEQMRETFVARGADGRQDRRRPQLGRRGIFDAAAIRRAPAAPDRFTLICHGAIEESYGLDTLIRAAALLRDELPGLRVEIYGEGTYRDELARLATSSASTAAWLQRRLVPDRGALAAIAAADVGVVAMRRDAFRDLTHCNKMFDFIAMRRPAVVSRTRVGRGVLRRRRASRCSSPGDEHDLARAIRALHADPGARRAARRARDRGERAVPLGAPARDLPARRRGARP